MSRLKIFKTVSDIRRIKYRNDINFLRAIAVISVVVYHSDLNLFKAGYLGVDLFFAISGYLISNIIISELNSNNFSFRNFYLRRIRRIIPALISTIIFTSPLAFIYLPVNDYITYAKSVFASIFFYSNIFFSNLDFYNSSSAELMPLLHTWSLAVEEQFYILFPLLVVVIFKFDREHILKIVIIISLISFFLNQSPISDKFYLTQFRVWEILLGVLANFTQRIRINKLLKNIAYLLILFPLFYFDDSWILDIEPKILILTGIFLILVSKDDTSWFSKVADFKLSKIIGLSSYSIYLFHQPVFAFYKWHLMKFQTDVIYGKVFDSLLLLIFILLISYFNYSFVEKSFIRKKSLKTTFLLPVIFTILAFQTLILETNGFFTLKYDMPEKVILYDNSDNYAIKKDNKFCHHSKSNLSRNICVFNDQNSTENIFIFGDSHAKLISSYIAPKLNDRKVHLITGDSCIFLVQTIVPDCARKDKEQLINFEDEVKNSVVIYIANVWDKLDKGLSLEKKVPETINYFLSNNNFVIVVYQIPHFRFDILNNYYLGITEYGESIIVESDDYFNSTNTKRSNNIYDQIQNQNLRRVFPEKIFCEEILAGFCVAAIGDNIYYEDTNHLTIEGSKLVGDKILELLQNS
jgi:peptidoglycan/LPS O-acetylase OafA/YrhL